MAELLLREIEYNMLNPRLAPSPLPLSLEKICGFIDGALQDKITLRDLSKAGAGSPATVCRLFSKHMGMRPFAWINKKRIEMAAELLLSTDLRIGEIAVKVGIPDYYYFSKLFSRFKGVSAGEFRKENSFLI